MRCLILLLAGCWQSTFYVGPRVADDGDVGLEVGATFGATQPLTRDGAVAASIDASQFVHARSRDAVARSTRPPAPLPAEGAIRGIVEWVERPRASTTAFERARGLGWRAGVYAGAEFFGEEAPQARGLFGATATLSPWVWGLDHAPDQQFIALGVQLGVDVIGDRYVGRAAIAVECQFWPRVSW